jgi:hypothetical protein
MKSRGLAGLWFHTLDPVTGAISQQGRVVRSLGGNVYLVQFYDWLVGEPGRTEAVAVSRMDGWQFYETDEAMRHAYETQYEARP